MKTKTELQQLLKHFGTKGWKNNYFTIRGDRYSINELQKSFIEDYNKASQILLNPEKENFQLSYITLPKIGHIELKYVKDLDNEDDKGNFEVYNKDDKLGEGNIYCGIKSYKIRAEI